MPASPESRRRSNCADAWGFGEDRLDRTLRLEVSWRGTGAKLPLVAGGVRGARVRWMTGLLPSRRSRQRARGHQLS